MGTNNTFQKFPMSLGYCGVGYVEEAGSDVKKICVDNKVSVYHGCHAKYNIRPDNITKAEKNSDWDSV